MPNATQLETELIYIYSDILIYKDCLKDIEEEKSRTNKKVALKS